MTLELEEDSTTILTEPTNVVEIWQESGYVRFSARFFDVSDVISLSLEAELALKIGQKLIEVAEFLIAGDEK